MFFRKTAILGVGLLGASLALALRKKGLTEEISGFGRSARNLEEAKARGIIDSYFHSGPAGAVREADLIVFATPVGVFRQLAKSIKGSLKTGSIQMDLGSIKGRLVYEMENILPRFVGCHPISGGERQGIGAASEHLFEGSRCIITQTEKTDGAAVGALTALWKEIGCKVEFMEPFAHDEIYALVSHLPHLVAYALVNTVGESDADRIKYAGKGFKDTTRIAMSSPELWRDVCQLNGENLLRFISVFKKKLERLEDLIAGHDPEGLEREFDSARKLRSRIER